MAKFYGQNVSPADCKVSKKNDKIIKKYCSQISSSVELCLQLQL